ncbi:hypothetical protein TNCV_1884311 [Trichonephila clavipes]|nr:hypothetical protein TNCV_1884311 [Trichonephila clavipes]
MLRTRKTEKFVKCRNPRVSSLESSRKVNARRITRRRIRFLNQFSKISVTLSDKGGRPYFRHTMARVYLKPLEPKILVPEGSRDGQTELDIRSRTFP